MRRKNTTARIVAAATATTENVNYYVKSKETRL